MRSDDRPGEPLPAPSTAYRERCPDCGGRLGPPVSGDVHCTVTCTVCGAEFELDDPAIARSGPAGAR
ncbi:MAG TPA: hypothetical protein VEL82_08675 [Thermoplasmata archaeon]|nr:hypothetical protein [Thermoplasmata archaeon]